MKRKNALALIAALVAALALIPACETRASSPDHRFITYRLSLSGDPYHPKMRLEINGWVGEVSLSLPHVYGKGLVVEPFRRLRDFKALDEQGRDLPLTVLENGVSFISPGQSALEYSADLTVYRDGSDRLQSLACPDIWTYLPLAGDYLYLPGYVLFLAPDDPGIPCRVELDLPTGWTWAGALVGEEVVSGDLWNDPLLAGELTFVERDKILLAYPFRETAHLGLTDMAKNAQSMLAELEAHLPGGMTPDKVYLFLLPLSEEWNGKVPMISEPFTRTLTLPISLGTSPLSNDVLGELARKMAGMFIRRHLNLSDEALWFGEGLSWYLRDMLPYRVGLWGASLSWDRLLSQFRVYEQTAGHVSPYQAGEVELPGERDMVMVCHGGAVACAAMDAEIQGSGPGSMDILRLLGMVSNLKMEKGEERPITTRDIQEILASMTGKNWKPFFDNFILGNDVIPASSFSSLKVAPRGEGLVQPIRTGSPGLGKWATLVLAVLLVLALPFFLEPYALRPRKEGFLEKILKD